MKGVIVLAASMLVLSSTGYALTPEGIYRQKIEVSTAPIATHFDQATYRKVLQEARNRAYALDTAGLYKQRNVISTSPISGHFDQTAIKRILDEARQRAFANGYGVVDPSGKYITLPDRAYMQQVGGAPQLFATKKDAKLAGVAPNEAIPKARFAADANGVVGTAEAKDLLQQQYVPPIAPHFNAAAFFNDLSLIRNGGNITAVTQAAVKMQKAN